MLVFVHPSDEGDGLSIGGPSRAGVTFVVIGNLIPRARPNWFVGIRTPWTLSSDRVWEKTHRIGGYAFVVMGILVALGGLFGTVLVMPWMGGVIGAIVLGLVIYSYVEWRREGSVSRRSSSV